MSLYLDVFRISYDSGSDRISVPLTQGPTQLWSLGQTPHAVLPPAVKSAIPLCVLMSVTVVTSPCVLTRESDVILLNIHEAASASQPPSAGEPSASLSGWRRRPACPGCPEADLTLPSSELGIIY